MFEPSMEQTSAIKAQNPAILGWRFNYAIGCGAALPQKQLDLRKVLCTSERPCRTPENFILGFLTAKSNTLCSFDQAL